MMKTQTDNCLLILFVLSKIIRYACYCVAHGSTAAAAEKAIAVDNGDAK